MCGIAGLMQCSAAWNAVELEAITKKMCDAIRHRGPDAGGVWLNEGGQVALGHRRLSILDLSEAGAQPMVHESGRYVLSYNGEIYNFRTLRKELEARGVSLRGHSDTEVLLAVIATWGLEEALERIEGMFAFALWDDYEQSLSLVRDRAGKKPLYYGWFGGSFGFASELKALRQCPGFDTTLDQDALGDFVVHGWVPHPASIYKAIKKLPPGCWLKLRREDSALTAEPMPYWRASELFESGERACFQGSYDDAVNELEERLVQAIDERMVADVDLGALLSGGIDSSLVVALMQKMSDRPVKTFTIGFNEEKYDEAPFAADVAGALGTDHQEMYVSADEALEVLQSLPMMYDEPFADASQIPTHLVCKLARESVTVVLSGDGGDEVFCGYNRYQRFVRDWNRKQRLPRGLRSTVSSFQQSFRKASWHLLGPSDPFSDQSDAMSLGKLGRNWSSWLAEDIRELQGSDFRKGQVGSWFVPGAAVTASPLTDTSSWADVRSQYKAICHYDFMGYLTDDILVKVDRASMAISLEVRSPLLDRRIMGFAWSLPENYLVSGGVGKQVLRELLYRYVPRQLVDRPKKGFSVPVAGWIRGELRAWAEDLLSEDFLRRQGIFDVNAVRTAWGQHLSGWDNHSEILWAVLMFQSWWLAQRAS